MRHRVRSWHVLLSILSVSALLSLAATPSAADPASSNTQVSVSANRTSFGAAITVQVLVSGAGIPTGSITVLDQGKSIASSTLDANGASSISISNLTIGVHSLTAFYAGDGSNGSSSSAPATVTVVQKTHIDLLIYSQPKVVASTWTPTTPLVLVANVIKASPVGTRIAPSGTVTFTVDGQQTTLPVTGLHHANLIFPGGLPLGVHVATAHYNGDSTFGQSTSPSRTIKVRRNLVTTISVQPDPIAAGATVTYTVTVTNAGLASALNVAVVDALPPEASFVSATAAGGCSGTVSVTCLIGTVRVGASATVAITVLAPSVPPPSGTLLDAATATPGMNPTAMVSTAVTTP